MSTNRALLTDEHIVMTSTDNTLSLSNKRVWFDASDIGRSEYVSITLDAVASCGLTTRSYPMLLLFAGLAVAALLAIEMFWLLLVAAGFVFVYFLTRRSLISIASNGGERILASARGLSREAITDFLQAVEQEKLSQR